MNDEKIRPSIWAFSILSLIALFGVLWGEFVGFTSPQGSRSNDEMISIQPAQTRKVATTQVIPSSGEDPNERAFNKYGLTLKGALLVEFVEKKQETAATTTTTTPSVNTTNR